MILRYVLGVVVSACSVVAAVYLSGGIFQPGYAALDLFLVMALPLGVGLSISGARGLGSAFRSALGSGTPSAPDLRAAASTFKWLGRATFVAMAAGFISIQIWMMYDLQDPAAIPEHLAWSLEPVVLGLFLALCVFRPLRYASEARLMVLYEGPVRSPSASPAESGRWSPLRWASGAAVIIIALVAWNIAAHGRLAPFFELSALSMSLFLTLGQALAGPGLEGLRDAFTALRSGDRARLVRARQAFGFLSGSFAVSAGLAFAVGAAYFLQGLGDRKRYGPTMALVEVGFLQSAVFALLVGLPLLAAADRALAAASSEPSAVPGAPAAPASEPAAVPRPRAESD
jgi:hypothetical protein